MGVEDRDWWRERQKRSEGPARAPGDELWSQGSPIGKGESAATWLATIVLVTACVSAIVLAVARPPFVDVLLGRGKAWLEGFNVKMPTAGERTAAAKKAGAPCDPTEEVRTMSTRWPSAGEALPGRSMELANQTAQEIFVRLHDATTGRLTQTALIMPREKIREPVFAAEMTVQLRLGSVWCNRLDGWKDAREVPVESRIRPGVGVVEVVLQPAIGQEGLALVIKQLPNATPSTRPQAHRGNGWASAAPQSVPKLALQPPQTPDARSTGIDNLRQAATRQEALIAHLQRQQGRQAGIANPPMPHSAAPRIQPRAPEVVEDQAGDLPQHVRISDWRDVPRRDIRVVTSGDRHFIGGQVADEDVQFELSLHGHSAIGEGLARAVGATGCQHGPWFVLGRYVGSCRAVVRSVRFGTVELDNVLMVVLPGNRQPVLGPDILGKVHLFHGPDGQYASVGN